MLDFLSYRIALRYIRAKRRNSFISFISLASMLGIALGVAVLITVLSVMNGFDAQISKRIFGVARQITISGIGGAIPFWQDLQTKIKDYPGVVTSVPFVDGQGILTSNMGGVHGTAIVGVDPKEEPKVSSFDKKMVTGSLTDLKSGSFNIILGEKLAEALGAAVGDKVNLMVPEFTMTPAGEIPRSKRFTVTGIFRIGNGIAFDSQMALININDAQKLFQLESAVTGLRLKLDNIYSAPVLAEQLRKFLSNSYQIRDWTLDYGNFFDAIKLEKTMMFLILILIVAVAAFNLVTSLVMIVNDKKSDIAILRTLGATPRTILRIFMLQGLIVGIVGTIMGLAGGILLSLNATRLVHWLENLLHAKLLSSSVYFVNYLPSQLQFSDVWKVCLIALALSFIATLYPAWNASRTQPAEALRYE